MKIFTLFSDPKGEDVIATMISEGWLTVKNTAPDHYKKLEEQAKTAKKGMHKDDKAVSLKHDYKNTSI